MSEQLSDAQAKLRAQIQDAIDCKYVVNATCVNIWFVDRGILSSKKGRMIGGRGTGVFSQRQGRRR